MNLDDKLHLFLEECKVNRLFDLKSNLLSDYDKRSRIFELCTQSIIGKISPQINTTINLDTILNMNELGFVDRLALELELTLLLQQMLSCFTQSFQYAECVGYTTLSCVGFSFKVYCWDRTSSIENINDLTIPSELYQWFLTEISSLIYGRYSSYVRMLDSSCS